MRFSPTFRISFGLVLITTSILLTADLLKLTPSNTKYVLNERKNISEALAVEFTIAAQKEQFDLINQTLELIVDRNEDIISAGLRHADGNLLSQNGNHEASWQPPEENQSTVTHVVVPIHRGEDLWGSVEIQFSNIHPLQIFGIGLSPLGQLLLFVGLAGFVGYMFLIHRTLRYLNPSSVVPGRVQFALDALRSSVVLLNESGEIVLSNDSFSSLFKEETLLGKKLEKLAWKDKDTNRSLTNFPWVEALKSSTPVTGINIRLKHAEKLHTYVVNCTPILDAGKEARGALVSFEDISEIQERNDQLRTTLDELEASRIQIEKQNQELTVLASRDPMTGCLNRRAFFECLEPMFVESKENGSLLSCIMTDIDHFKLVNDNHGHQVGDEVIKFVANILENESRSIDIVCRYGGEEFCILLPELDMEAASVIAENIRYAIETQAKLNFDKTIKVTSSFGISSTTLPTSNPLNLINLADQALYDAKENGRNKVSVWSESLAIENKEQSDEQLPSTTSETEQNTDSQQLITKINELQSIIDQQSKELIHQSAYDPYTGLPSRLLFEDRVNQSIAQAMRQENKIVVISVAVQAFKRIHDTFGNIAAEDLMKQASKRLAQVLRSSDTIATLNQSRNKRTTISRISPDEFGVLITDLNTVEPVTWIIKRILNSLAPPIHINDNEVALNGYIGASLHPEDGDVAEILINKAATARHHAAEQPEDTHYKFYSNALNEASVRLINLESQLHNAISNNQIFLHYQPKVNMHSGKIIGLEALIRWKHPTRGFIPPIEFIPIAERSGLIIDLGIFVLRSTCEQIKKWLDAGLQPPRVAVNLSPIQLRQPDLFNQVKSVLKETGVEPRFLELEITEGTAMSCLESAIETTRQFQAYGIRVSLDDFGTGFSSLNYLRLLPVDTLKIDRSFITDLVTDKDNLAIVAAIIAMSHKLGMTVLAEGVEYNNQYRLLSKLKCDEVQGYLVSMPVPAEEIDQLLLSEFNFSVEETATVALAN